MAVIEEVVAGGGAGAGVAGIAVFPPPLPPPAAATTSRTPLSSLAPQPLTTTPPAPTTPAASAATPSTSVRDSHVKAAGKAMTLSIETTTSSPVPSPSTSTGVPPESEVSSEETLLPTTSETPLPSETPSPSLEETPGPSTQHTSLDIIPTGTPGVPDPSSTAIDGIDNTDSESSSSSSSGLPFGTPVLAGIIAGGVVLLLLIGGACWVCSRRRRRQKRQIMEDDALGSGVRRRSKSYSQTRSHSRSRRRPSFTQARSDDRLQTTSRGHIQQRGDDLAPPGRSRAGLSRAEARASVQLAYPSRGYQSETLAAPSRAFGYTADDAATRSSAWTDNSEMDVFAVDGSTIARTLSTVSRPNSEYDLDDPGATWAGGAYPANGGGSYVNFGSASNMSHDSRAPDGTYMSSMSHSQHDHGAYAGRNVLSPIDTSYNPYAPSTAPSSEFASPNGTYSGFVQQAQRVQVPPQQQQMLSPPSQRLLAGGGPLQHQQQRVPAPRLLIDTKAPIGEDGMPLSAMSRAGTPSAAAGPSGTWAPSGSTLRTPLDRAPSAASRAITPDAGWPYAVRNGGGSAAPSPASFRPPMRSTSRSAADRPTALPYATGNEASPSATFGRSTPGGNVQSPTSPTGEHLGTGASGLRRGPTIIRHADAGYAFDDAVPEGEDDEELHLPPAYGDIYGPPQ